MNSSNNPFIVNGELDLGAVLGSILKERRLVLKITGGFVLLCIFYLLIATPMYQSSLSVYAVNDSQTGGALGNLAVPLGLLAGGGQDLHIPDIVGSNRLRAELLKKKWAIEGYEDSLDLVQFWDIDPQRIKLYNPISWLKWMGLLGRMSDSMQVYAQGVIADKELDARIVVAEEPSGLIRVSTFMEDPQLAAEIANFLTQALQNTIVSTRSGQAREKRLFIEDRLDEVKRDLNLAELKVAEFREQNRVITGSANLQMMLDRLLREVQIQTQIYITLQQEYESSRIEELNTTPPLVIVDDPVRPLEPARPQKLLLLFVSVFFGLMVGPVVVIVRILVKSQQEDTGASPSSQAQ